MSPTADAPYLSTPDSPDLGFEDDPLLEKRMRQGTGATSGEDGDARDWKARPSDGGARRRKQMLACAMAFLAAAVLAALFISTYALRSPVGTLAGTRSTTSGGTQYEYVATWRSKPLIEEGWLKKPVQLPQEILERENKTDFNSVFRSVIARPHYDPNYVAIRVIAQFWAFPFDKYESIHHRGPAFLDDPKKNNFTLRLEVSDAFNSKTLEARLHHYDWKYVEFLVPSRHLHLNTVEEDLRRFPLRFSLEWEGETAVAFEAELQQSWTPYSRQAICTRPIFGGASPLDYKEWRLHHGAMGFEIVHWGSRDAEMARDLEQLNKLTGYQDTFTYFPRFENRADNDFWEEHFMNNDCYSTHSHAAEFMGVWDLDELFAPANSNDLPWTRTTVAKWLDELHPDTTAVNLPWWWVNKPDFGPVPDEVLLAAQPDLDVQALADIATLKQNGGGLITKPDGGHYFVTKSLYRTSLTTSAKVHHGAPCCGLYQKSGVQFVVYHARQKAKIWKGHFSTYDVTPTIVRFWRDLGARLRQMEEPQ